MPKTTRKIKQRTLEWKLKRKQREFAKCLEGYHECGGIIYGDRKSRRYNIRKNIRTYWELFEKYPVLCRKLECNGSKNLQSVFFYHMKTVTAEIRRLNGEKRKRNDVWYVCCCFESSIGRGSDMIFETLKQLVKE